MPCREHRNSHQVDVISLAPGVKPRASNAQVTLLGEAKATNRRRGMADVARLEHIRELLGPRAQGARLALFSRTGFEPAVTDAERSGQVLPVTLEDIYQR